MAVMMIEDIAFDLAAGGDIQAAVEGVRLLKLYYFTIVEHVRSSEGVKAWTFAQNVAYSFANAEEIRNTPPQSSNTRVRPQSVKQPPRPQYLMLA